MVCWAREATAGTTEMVPRGTVRSGDMMTDRTLLRSIGRINVDYRDTGYSGLVIYVLPELIESPNYAVCVSEPLEPLSSSPYRKDLPTR